MTTRALAVLLVLISASAIAAPGRIMFRDAATLQARAMSTTDSAQTADFHLVGSESGLPTPVGNVISLTAGIWIQTRDLVLSGTNEIRVPAGVKVEWYGGGHSLTGAGARVFNIEGQIWNTNVSVVNNVGDGYFANSAAASMEFEKVVTETPLGIGINAQSTFFVVVLNHIAQNSATGIRLGASTGGMTVTSSGFLNNAIALRFDGAAVATLSNLSILSAVASATHIKVEASASLSQWVLTGSVLTAGDGQTALDLSSAAFGVQGANINNITCSTSGTGVCITGVTANTSQARFSNNIGLANSAPQALAKRTGGSSATSLGSAGVYVPLVGTTTTTLSQLFSCTGGACTNQAGRSLTCTVAAQVDGTASATAGEYNLAIFLNHTTIQAIALATIPPSSSTLSTVTFTDRFVIPAGQDVDLHVSRPSVSGGTFTWLGGLLRISECN